MKTHIYNFVETNSQMTSHLILLRIMLSTLNSTHFWVKCTKTLPHFCIRVVKYKFLTYLGKYNPYLPFASDSRGVTRHGSVYIYFQYELY